MVQKASTFLHLDEKIYIAVSMGVAAGDRPEYLHSSRTVTGRDL